MAEGRLDITWHLSQKLGDGWLIRDAEGGFVETVYRLDVGDRIVSDHNEIISLRKGSA